MVAALHARSVESPLPLLVAATVAKASPCLWPLPRAAPGPHGAGAGSTLVPGRSPAAFSAVRPLGCLIRLNVSPWVKKMVGCVFFPPRYEAAAGIRTPSYDWLHILESLGHQCGGSESDKSQERTDLLSEGTGLIYRAGKL